MIQARERTHGCNDDIGITQTRLWRHVEKYPKLVTSLWQASSVASLLLFHSGRCDPGQLDFQLRQPAANLIRSTPVTWRETIFLRGS